MQLVQMRRGGTEAYGMKGRAMLLAAHGLPLVLIAAAGLSCAGPLQAQTPEGEYRIQRLSPGQTINVGDHSLSEWEAKQAVMSIGADTAEQHQRRQIRGRAPLAVSAGDAAVTVYMARDETYWYVGVDIQDDIVLSGSPAYPYSGDCLEVFFVGQQLDSDQDFHQRVISSRSSDQRAFFQLELLAGATVDSWDYFPEHRTGVRFRGDALRQGFTASTWITALGWAGEARIPFAAFEADVQARIERGEALKMNINYLDYDTRIASRTATDGWAFRPDNVFGLDPTEANVNVPRYMRSVRFE
jgi:hypothetical protein